MKQKSATAGSIQLIPPVVEGASAGQSLLDSESQRQAIDELDMTLVGLLLGDATLSNRDLAAAAGITNATAGSRVKRLVAERVLIFTALFDWEAAGYEWFVIAKINAEGRTPQRVADDLAALPECEAVAIVFGDVDVLAYFLVKDRAELHHLIADSIGKIPGIGSLKIDMVTQSSVTPLGKQFYLARSAPPIRLPDPVIDLDELDIAIMQALLDNGRQSNRNIARQLEVSEGTIRTRITRLTSSGLMRIVAMVEPLALGMAGVIATVGLRVDRSKIASVAEKIRKHPQALFVAMTVGSVDISVTIAAADQSNMLSTILKDLRSLKGVRSTETLQMIDVVRFAPYMKRFE